MKLTIVSILSILLIISIVNVQSIDGEVDCANIIIDKVAVSEWDYKVILDVDSDCETQWYTIELIDNEFDFIVDTRLIGGNEVSVEYDVFVDIPYCFNISQHYDVDNKFTIQQCFIVDTNWANEI